MGNLSISSIQDQNLRKAAEKADSQGANSYDGNLSSDEISVFIREAKALGCSMSDVMQIVNQVGINKDDAANFNKQAKLANEITQLEKKIVSKKQLLKDKESQLEELKPSFMEHFSTAQRITGAAVGTLYAGIGGGVTAGALVGAGVALTGPVGIAAVGTAALVCFAGGALIGAEFGGFIENGEKSYSYQMKEKKARTFETEQVIPLKNEIAELEKQLNKKINELNR